MTAATLTTFGLLQDDETQLTPICAACGAPHIFPRLGLQITPCTNQPMLILPATWPQRVVLLNECRTEPDAHWVINEHGGVLARYRTAGEAQSALKAVVGVDAKARAVNVRLLCLGLLLEAAEGKP